MALNFAGGTNAVNWGGSGWNFTPGAFAFWMKTTQVTVNACIGSIWTNTSRNGFGFLINNTLNKITVQGYTNTSTTGVNFTSTISVNDGNWHHIGFNFNTANGGANALFIDGASHITGNATATWTIASNGVPLCFGDNTDSFWPSYVGDIAEAAAWRRQLDAAEMAALAQGFSPARIANASLTFHAPLVRSAHNRWDGFINGPTGATVSDHPKLIGFGL